MKRVILISLLLTCLFAPIHSQAQASPIGVDLDCDQQTIEINVHPEQNAPVNVNCVVSNTGSLNQKINVDGSVEGNGFSLILSESSFELAAGIAFRESTKKAEPTLLEPIMSVEVVSPDEFTGPVTGDLNKRRGIMKGMDMKGNAQIIKADVPLSELFGYVTDLRTISSGRASASLTFSHYEKVPKNIADEIISKVNA